MPMPAAAIFVHTPVSSAHALPSYRRMALTVRDVSSHSAPACGSLGASVPTL